MFRLWAVAAFVQAALAACAGVATASLFTDGADWWLALRDAAMCLILASGALVSLSRYARRRISNRRQPPSDSFPA